MPAAHIRLTCAETVSGSGTPATPRPARGRVLITHLGVGLADVIFGQAILAEAIRRGLGIPLPR